MAETIKLGMRRAEAESVRESIHRLRLEQHLMMTRRQFFGRCSLGIGTAALATLLTENGHAAMLAQGGEASPASRGCRISRPRRSGSFTCFSRARRRNWNSSITSRSLKNIAARICRNPSGWDSG